MIGKVHKGLIVRGQDMRSADYRALFRAQHEAARS
jgi:hypothetical protein